MNYSCVLLGSLLIIAGLTNPVGSQETTGSVAAAVSLADLVASNDAEARSQLRTGLAWRAGNSGKIDDAKSLELVASSAAMGDPAAVLLYGCLADKTTTYALARRRASEVLSRVRDSADEFGNGALAYCVGLAYSDGIGGRTDFVKAAKYFEKGVADSDSLSMNALGGMLMRGEGVTTDTSRAQELLERAIAAGCVRAKSNLGRLKYDAGDTTGGLTLLAQGANAGDSSAAVELGILHVQGTPDGVIQPDPEQAAKWWSYAASELDSPQGAFNLARLMQSGHIKPNYNEAVRLMRKAAFANCWPALVELGKAAYEGNGQPRDYRAAFSYWSRAARGGSAEGMYNMAFLLDRGEGVTTDPIEANRWLKKAAESGLPEAMYDLGLQYALGGVLDKSTTQAIQWFERSASAAQEQGKHEMQAKAIDTIKGLTGGMFERSSDATSVVSDDAARAGQTTKTVFFSILAIFIFLGSILFFLSRRRS